MMTRILLFGLFAFALFRAVEPLDASADQFGYEAKIYDEATIQKVAQDIRKMEEPELRAFVHYLAECEDVIPNEPVLQFCKVAANTYELEFDKDRALDNWISANQDLLNLPAKMQIAGHEGETPQQSVDRMLRQARLDVLLHKAVRDRFDELKTTK